MTQVITNTCVFPHAFLLLDKITLFYHNISSTFTQPSKPGGLVKNWHAIVAKEVKPASKIKCEGPGSLVGSTYTAKSTTIARTTASSMAMQVKTEKSSDTAVSGITSGLGGFNDEDETEECDHALSSPIKGKNK